MLNTKMTVFSVVVPCSLVEFKDASEVIAASVCLDWVVPVSQNDSSRLAYSST